MKVEGYVVKSIGTAAVSVTLSQREERLLIVMASIIGGNKYNLEEVLEEAMKAMGPR